MVLATGAKKHLETRGRTISTMADKEKVYLNCARCTKGISVTDTYKARMDAKHIPILCNDCRNQAEVVSG